MLLNSNPPTTVGQLAGTGEVLGIPRRITTRMLKVFLWGGAGWFAYHFASQMASFRNTFQESGIATIAFLALAFTVAAYLAMHQQAHLMEQTQADSVRHQGAEAEKAGLVAAIEEISDAVVITDGEGTIQYVNPAYTRITGWAAEEVIGRNSGKEKFGLSPVCRQQVLDSLRTGRAWRGEVWSERKNGSPYLEEVTVSPVRDSQGVIRKCIAVRRDITSRRAAEEAKSFLAAVMESSEDAIMRSNAEGIILSWSHGAEAMYGYTADQILGQSLSVLASANRTGEITHILEKVGRGETVSQFETVAMNRNGGLIDLYLTVSPMRNCEGKIVGSSVIARDISRRRKDREALEESEERYRSLVANLPDVIWVADDVGQPVFVSSNCLGMSGYSPQEICQPGLWMNRVHTEDLACVETAYRALFQEDQALNVEYRFLRKDGQWIWVHSRAVSTHESNGRRYRNGLLSDITERKRMEQTMAHQATHDLLTGLPNRAVFEDRFSLSLARARRQGGMAALLYMDLDRFKRINDTLGHVAGDRLIQLAAARLAGCLRKSETVARSGGDRFMLVVSDVRDPQDAVHVAERIQAVLAQPFSVNGHEVFLSASIGVAIYPQDGGEMPALQRAADSALAAAKRQGKQRVQISTPEINQAAGRRLAVETELHYAMERGELSLDYQPQFDLATNRVAGLEALVRWDNPKFGRVPASVLIPIAEETGLIVPIGAHVLWEACQQGKLWCDAGYGPIHVAVNTSAVQFARGDLPETVAAVLARTAMQPLSGTGSYRKRHYARYPGDCPATEGVKKAGPKRFPG